jgi:putative transposase
MSMVNRKTEAWLASIRATKKKRKTQTCKVYELKIQSNHLSTEKKTFLKMLFVEAKRFYNYILSSEDIFAFDTKNNFILYKDKDKNDIKYEIQHMSSQIKQSVKQRLIYAIKALATMKKKGQNDKVGKLTYRSKVNSIVLNQFGVTYKFEKDGKYFHIQGFKKSFRINGYKQIPPNAEFANATLIRKCDGYYLKITCFVPKEVKTYKQENVGIDFGIKDSITLSTGDKYNVVVPISNDLKQKHRNLSHKKLGSHNRYKAKIELDKAYEKNNRRKKDKRNKLVSTITNEFETVIVQDESIKAWQSGLFGKRISESCLGGIMSDIEKKSHTFVKIDKFFPSTQICPSCGKKNKHELSERVYHCDCGYTCDRDTHAARNILNEGLRIKSGMGHISTMQGERKTSALGVSA